MAGATAIAAISPPPPPVPAALPSVQNLLPEFRFDLVAVAAALLSAVVHLATVVALAAWTVAARPDPAAVNLVVSSLPSTEVVEESPAAEFSLTLLPVTETNNGYAAFTSVTEPEDVSISQESETWNLTSLTTASSRGGPLGEINALLGGAASSTAAGSPAGAEFYGIRAGGGRFVYVVDCSTSMNGPKWRMAREELLYSLRKLGSERWFFVILFDGAAHPMLELEEPEHRLLPATEENIARCETWLNNKVLGNDTRPFTSMRMALGLQPDAIFLLTDGEFVDNTAAHLKQHNARREGGKRAAIVPVHTIGLVTRKGQTLLKRIARENDGVFQFVEAAP